MAWSTREIAELAGTSLRTVRHYHAVGLLDEPERDSNGYKRYGVTHLVRLLHVRRLVDLGFSLPQIAAMAETDDDPAASLRALDTQLAETIERLQRARGDLAVLLAQPTPDHDLPAELAPLAGRELTDADRGYLTVLSRVVSPATMEAYLEVTRAALTEPANLEFDALPPDADEETRAAVAERMAPWTRAIRAAHPFLSRLSTDATAGPHRAGHDMRTALAELYNPAQLDVLRRLEALL